MLNLRHSVYWLFQAKDFPNINQDAGWIGLTIVITGLFGSVIAGLWLDKTKLFK